MELDVDGFEQDDPGIVRGYRGTVSRAQKEGTPIRMNGTIEAIEPGL